MHASKDDRFQEQPPACAGQRDYPAMSLEAARRCSPGMSLHDRQAVTVDVLWAGLKATGVSWVGFYSIDKQHSQMILGCCRDKPACSPIGLHGACGRSFQEAAPLVVKDVHDLGANYVACDPRDRSEVVVPFYGGSTSPLGVLDLYSFEDVAGLESVLAAAGMGRQSPAAKVHSLRFLALVADARRRVRECSAADVHGWLAHGDDFFLVDVREESEFASGHVPGAKHIGRGVLERDIETRIPDCAARIVLYCGGGYRSALAADSLQKMGYTNVTSMWGGWRAWTEHGFPLKARDPRP
jgi:rhodanese-related sulfurtransferase/putative methionine-R-sulfoxide reductase with GAF domain